MNLTSDDVASGVLHDRVHTGASLADVEPMAIDKSVRSFFSDALRDEGGGLLC